MDYGRLSHSVSHTLIAVSVSIKRIPIVFTFSPSSSRFTKIEPKGEEGGWGIKEGRFGLICLLVFFLFKVKADFCLGIFLYAPNLSHVLCVFKITDFSVLLITWFLWMDCCGVFVFSLFELDVVNGWLLLCMCDNFWISPCDLRNVRNDIPFECSHQHHIGNVYRRAANEWRHCSRVPKSSLKITWTAWDSAQFHGLTHKPINIRFKCQFIILLLCE